MVSASDLKWYMSSTGINLGGAISGTEIKSANPNNIFWNVPKHELVLGEDYYACIYIKNTHATEGMDNFNFWLSSKSFPHDTELKWGRDANQSLAQTIPDKYTAPTDVTWRVLGTRPENPIFGISLDPGEIVAIWLWRHVDANADARLDDNAIFSFEFQIPLGGTGSTGGGDIGGSGGNPPPTVTDYKIAYAADWGCESETDDVIDLIQDQGYDHVIGGGDNAYASSSCWINRFTPLKSIMESAFGNHEYSESGGITPYKNFFGYGKTYLTYKFRNVQVFIIDTNINCDSGSTQWNFIRDALVASQTDNTITWRIACFHHPMYGASSKHSYNEGDTRENFHQLFITNKVNFVLTAHNHNWQRTHQIAYSGGSTPTVIDNTSPYSRTAAGFIHVISGAGGHDSGSSLYSLGSQPGYQAYQNRTHNGVWEMVSSSSGNTLTCRFRDISGDTYDTFTIS